MTKSLLPMLLLAVVAGCSASTGSSTSSSGGGADAGTSSARDAAVATCDNQTAALPTTRVTVDGETYYLVLQTDQSNASVSRTQLNFGTEAQFRRCPDEPGQNSTFGLVITFQGRITTGGSHVFTSDRSVSEPGTVNFYMSFYRNTGHARADKNFKSPDTGSLDVTVAAGRLGATLSNVAMLEEVGMTETFPLSGTLDLAW